jgi:hypothetical protein
MAIFATCSNVTGWGEKPRVLSDPCREGSDNANVGFGFRSEPPLLVQPRLRKGKPFEVGENS